MIVVWSKTVHSNVLIPMSGPATSSSSALDPSLINLSSNRHSMTKTLEKQLETKETAKKSKYESFEPFLE